MNELQLQLFPSEIYSTSESEKFSIFFTPIYGCLLKNISQKDIVIDKICLKLMNEENTQNSTLELSKEVLEKRNSQYSSNPHIQELLDLIFRNSNKNNYSNSFSLNIKKEGFYSLVHIWLFSPFDPKKLTIEVHYNSTKTAEYHIPVSQLKQNNQYHFPIKGSSYIIDGTDLRSSNHKMFDLQSNGIDIVKITNFKSDNDFLKVQNHDCFNEKVYSAYKGTVVEVQDNYDDNFHVDKLVNSNLFFTLMTHRNKRLILLNEDKNPTKSKSLLGNYVLIKHDNNEYSLYCHLKKNSIEVKVKQNVDTGEKIARVGNSGSSIFPHLHFQVMNREDIFNSSTIPIIFHNISGHIFPLNRPLFTGDLIKTF